MVPGNLQSGGTGGGARGLKTLENVTFERLGAVTTRVGSRSISRGAFWGLWGSFWMVFEAAFGVDLDPLWGSVWGRPGIFRDPFGAVSDRLSHY